MPRKTSIEKEYITATAASERIRAYVDERTSDKELGQKIRKAVWAKIKAQVPTMKNPDVQKGPNALLYLESMFSDVLKECKEMYVGE